MMCPPRSRTFSVRIIAPAARTANATAKTSDYKHKTQKSAFSAQKETKINCKLQW